MKTETTDAHTVKKPRSAFEHVDRIGTLIHQLEAATETETMLRPPTLPATPPAVQAITRDEFVAGMNAGIAEALASAAQTTPTFAAIAATSPLAPSNPPAADPRRTSIRDDILEALRG